MYRKHLGSSRQPEKIRRHRDAEGNRTAAGPSIKGLIKPDRWCEACRKSNDEIAEFGAMAERSKERSSWL